MLPTLSQFNDAVRSLESAGWVLTETRLPDISSGPAVTEFGRLYVKGGRAFWLNMKTVTQTPTN